MTILHHDQHPIRHPLGVNAGYEDYKRLLDGGYDPLYYDANGISLLHHAAQYGRPGALQAFVERGVPIARIRTSNGWTVLHYAVAKAQVDHVKALLRLGCNANARDKKGRTPLHWIAIGSNKAEARTACAEVLLAAGADPAAECEQGYWPMDYVVVSDCSSLVSTLLRSQPKAPDKLNALLVTAIKIGHPAIIETVALAGADLHHRVNGRTLLQIAKDPDVKRLIRSLRTTQLIGSAMTSDTDEQSQPSTQPNVL